MEGFAIITIPDGGNRYIQSHPLLKRLPNKWAYKVMGKMKPRITGILQGNGQGKGYIIDVPHFFIQKDRHNTYISKENIEDIIELCNKNHIKIFSFPLWAEFITIEDVEIFTAHNIVMLDGYLIRIASLMNALEHIFAILNPELHTMKIGIWRADTIVGCMWAEFLAPYFNELTLGGIDTKKLEHLSNHILKTFGLSCAITQDIGMCVENKGLVIITETKEYYYTKDIGIKVLSGGLDLRDSQGGLKTDNSSIVMESGWCCFQNYVNSHMLEKPWDQIGVLDAMLFICDDLYRDIVMGRRMDLATFRQVKQILKKSKIYCTGIVSGNRFLSYDGFRKSYFGRK